MTDVYCPKCGEPCDPYEFHDTAKELQTTYADVARMFRTDGCDALPGWRCNPETHETRAALAREVYATSGDDMDGAAADLADVDILAVSTPEPAPIPTDPIGHAVIVHNKPQAADLARTLLAATEATSRDPYREMLHGILIEMDAEQWQIVATDSYVMVRMTLPAPNPDGTTPPIGSWQIHKDHAKQWAKQLGARTTNYSTVTISNSSLTLAVNNADQTTTVPRPTGTFPNYRTIWPDLDTMNHDERWTSEPVGWNPEKLAQMAKSWRHLTKDGTITTERTAPTKPNVWHGTADQIRWEWLAMPVRLR